MEHGQIHGARKSPMLLRTGTYTVRDGVCPIDNDGVLGPLTLKGDRKGHQLCLDLCLNIKLKSLV